MARPNGRTRQQAERSKSRNRSGSQGTIAAAIGHPIQTLAIVVGIGALLGFLAGRRGGRGAN
jgi:ElaB/YqjD/DUF883 family membrane-anchored ribosome-binding protein